MSQSDVNLAYDAALETSSRPGVSAFGPTQGSDRASLLDLAPRPVASGEEAISQVAKIVRRSRSSFTWGMRALRKERREAIFTVYAFCRIVDDIADCQSLAVDRQNQLLDAWQQEIARVYGGTPVSGIGHLLARAANRFDLPEREFQLMLDGMRMDVDGPVVAPPHATLRDYIRRVAGSVGVLSIRIFGARDCPERDDFALALAEALQLTNILRDIEEDAGIGRVYLPRELLDAHDMPTDPDHLLPARVGSHPATPAICSELSQQARRHFNEARAALPALDHRTVRPALMMMGVYEGYLNRMEVAGHVRDPQARTMPRWETIVRSLRYAYTPPSGVPTSSRPGERA